MCDSGDKLPRQVSIVPTPRQRLQRDVLKQRGMEPTHYHGLKPKEITPDDDSRKTLAMRLIEKQFSTPGRPAKIEELLLYGNLAATARHLGIGISTVSVWRLRLGLREPRTGIPNDS